MDPPWVYICKRRWNICRKWWLGHFLSRFSRGKIWFFWPLDGMNFQQTLTRKGPRVAVFGNEGSLGPMHWLWWGWYFPHSLGASALVWLKINPDGSYDCSAKKFFGDEAHRMKISVKRCNFRGVCFFVGIMVLGKLRVFLLWVSFLALSTRLECWVLAKLRKATPEKFISSGLSGQDYAKWIEMLGANLAEDIHCKQCEMLEYL